MPEKDETIKPDAVGEEHPQDALRREGLRLFPGAQTQHFDTTEGGGVADVRQISPVFEEARLHAEQAAAAAEGTDERSGDTSEAEPAAVGSTTTAKVANGDSKTTPSAKTPSK